MRIIRFSICSNPSAVLALSTATVVFGLSQSHAQQSFGFSYSSSSSFSSGGQPSKEFRSPGEDSSTSYPTTNRNGFRNGTSKSFTNVNGHIVEKSSEDRDGSVVSTTRVLNGKQDVFIEESDELGVRVTIKENVRGKEKKSQYQAESRKALRKKHPAAFDWVRKYASEPNASNINMAGGNGRAGNAQAGGFAGGGNAIAGGNAAGAGDAAVGAFAGPDAHQQLKQSIEQMIQQADDPTIKQQLRAALEQIQNQAAQTNR